MRKTTEAGRRKTFQPHGTGPSQLVYRPSRDCRVQPHNEEEEEGGSESFLDNENGPTPVYKLFR
jgi:hypothetical protein